MMKDYLKITILILLLITILAIPKTILPAAASPDLYFLFADDFNDGNTDGWWLGYSHALPHTYGNWRIENGVLVQDMGGDDFITLVENHIFSDQVLETKFKFNGPAGYGGFTLWFQDYNNLVFINVYPAAGGVGVAEWINGVGQSTSYPFSLTYDDAWHSLKVAADSVNEIIYVYMDGDFLFSHHTTTSQRTGRSGLMNGNGGGYFDDFKLSSEGLPPMTVFLPILQK